MLTIFAWMSHMAYLNDYPLKKIFIFFLLATGPLCAGDFNQDLFYLNRAIEHSQLNPIDLNEWMVSPLGETGKVLSASNAPWGSYYFPMDKGGAAWRWQTKVTPKRLLTFEEYSKMTNEEVNRLSATEKYDIWQGDFKFSTTLSELKNRGPLRIPAPDHWEGFCNGVRCAGVIVPEPSVSVTVTAPDGRVLTFEPADIKILLGVSYFYVEKYAQIGGPTYFTRKENPPNAAVFDLALRYKLENDKSFLIDPHLGHEIWNQSVIGYKRYATKPQQLTEEEKAQFPEAISRIRVRLKLHMLGSIDINATNGPTTDRVSNLELTQKVNTEYFLYLNSQGKVIDGAWNEKNKIKGIDFAWFASGDGVDSKYTDVGGNKHLSFSKVLALTYMSVEKAKLQNIKRPQTCLRFYSNN